MQANQDNERLFEDLTLAELVGQLLRSPRATLNHLIDFARTPSYHPAPAVRLTMPETYAPEPRAIKLTISDDKRRRMQLGMFISAFTLAFWGCLILISAETRYEAGQLNQGLPFILLGFVIWLGAEVHGDWPQIKTWWQERQSRSQPVQAESGDADDVSGGVRFVSLWQDVPLTRWLALIGVVIFGFIAWEGTQGNRWRFLGFWGWVISILLVVAVFAPASWSPGAVARRFREWLSRLRFDWTLLALLIIIVVAAYFRLVDLTEVPPEMTSDHIEKILDSNRVANGDRDVFFTNNGGREGFQMYAMALFAQLPGLGMNFTTLKLLAVIEGVLTIPVLFWMGRELVGQQNRTFGNVVGLVLAALVAVSYWHVAITRLALRIVLTPLVTALLIIFLSRGMRYNRRTDFILAGLTLGFSLYTYQAARMLPIIVVVGVALAFFMYFRDVRMRRRYIANFAILVIVSFVIFVPLFRFSVDYPDAFWMRTAGRLLGDDVIQVTDEQGVITYRDATIQERTQAFLDNLPVLGSNLRNALLMYNWKGDVAWINGVPNHPALDSITGAFLIVGLAAWLALSVRTRDPVYVLMPLAVVIMLLPSALSIAAPLENPSATRTSGSLPPVYLIAAFPLALITLRIQQVIPWRRIGLVAAVGVVVIAVGGAFAVNSDTYLNEYRESYGRSWKPHSEPGQVLRGFALSDGSYGNAFIVHYQHWLDHRIVGLEGGILDWPNAIISRDEIPDFLYDSYACQSKYMLDPSRDLLFFVNNQDEETLAQLREWFPEGREQPINSQYPVYDFYTYRVPAMGVERFETWANEHKDNPVCTF